MNVQSAIYYYHKEFTLKKNKLPVRFRSLIEGILSRIFIFILSTLTYIFVFTINRKQQKKLFVLYQLAAALGSYFLMRVCFLVSVHSNFSQTHRIGFNGNIGG